MKQLAVYPLLVGIPAAGLAVILNAGRGLQAPPPISGEWHLATPVVVGRDTVRAITVAQSGEHVQVTAGASLLRGRLHGDTLAVERRTSGSAPGAGCGVPAHLVVRIDTAAQPMRLAGAFLGDGPACPGVPVDATFAQEKNG